MYAYGIGLENLDACFMVPLVIPCLVFAPSYPLLQGYTGRLVSYPYR